MNYFNQELQFYWSKGVSRDRKKRKPTEKQTQFLEPVTFNQFGFNRESVLFPLKRNAVVLEKFMKHLNDEIRLPKSLIPTFSYQRKCPHGHNFSMDDRKLKLLYKKVKIYSICTEKTEEISLFGRPSTGSCNCMDQPDTSEWMLWNVGGSRLISYQYLVHCIHGLNNGIKFNAQYNTRKDMLSGCGVETDLKFTDLEKGIMGLQQKIQFLGEDWTCDGDKGCGDKWLLCDAKVAGPLKEKVSHLKELEPHPSDQNILQQGSYFKDRVFLHKKKERTLVRKLVNGDITANDFVASSTISSENGNLLKTMIRRLIVDFGNIPKQYLHWLEDLSKFTSVAGYIQVTSRNGLDLIEAVANKTLDLRSLTEIDRINQVRKEVPALFNALSDILKIEPSQYLHRDVRNILKKLVKIRVECVEQAPNRHRSDYVE